jgi:hypothetical protein
MVMALPNNRKMIGTREAATILGISMCRVRQLADDGTLWSDKPSGNARVFDETEIIRRSKLKRVTGRKPGGFRPG